MRIAVNGPGGWFASTNAAAQSLAVGSDWTHLTFSMDPSDFAPVGTATDINATLSAVSELRLVNTAQPDFRGDPVAASAGVDNMKAIVDATTTNGNGNYSFSSFPEPTMSSSRCPSVDLLLRPVKAPLTRSTATRMLPASHPR